MESTEIWRIAIYNGVTYEDFEVSNWGRIMSLNYRRTGKPGLMNPGEMSSGYLRVKLWKNGKYKMCLVHRLVAQTFLPNPEIKPEVNHKDEDKTNNFVFLNEDGSVDKEKSNLEWSTPKENSNHGTRNERISDANTNGKKSKKVLQFTLNGEFIREWPSTMECERNGFYSSVVCRCCRGERKTYKGFRWMYVEDYKEK